MADIYLQQWDDTFLHAVTSLQDGDRFNIQRRVGSWKNFGLRAEDATGIGLTIQCANVTRPVSDFYASATANLLPDLSASNLYYVPIRIVMKYTPGVAPNGSTRVFGVYRDAGTTQLFDRLVCELDTLTRVPAGNKGSGNITIPGVWLRASTNFGTGDGTLLIRTYFVTIPDSP